MYEVGGTQHLAELSAEKQKCTYLPKCHAAINLPMHT